MFICVYVCIYTRIRTRSSSLSSHRFGHLDCFHVLAVVNSATVNMGCMYLFALAFLFLSDVDPGVELLGHMVVP